MEDDEQRDDALREAQEGAGYGQDEGEREEALEDADSPEPGDA